MIGASALLVLAFLFTAGLSMSTALSVLLVNGVVNTLAAVYVVGLSGSAYIHNSYMWADWPLCFTWPQAPETYTTNWIMSHVFSSNSLNHITMGVQTGAYLTMQGLSLGNAPGISARKLFELMLLCTVIAVPITHATRVWITNTFGTGRVPIWGNCTVSNWCNDGFERYDAVPTTVQLEAGTVGFLIVTALSLLHARFVWWPIHPVGFILATSTTTMYMFEWNAFVGAWAAKFITLRVGGSKSYESYGVPVASGIIGGIVLASFLAYILGMIRFFVPF
jgi:hypothetical protein